MSNSPRPWISVVIPIKDERDNLPPLTEQLLKVLGAHERSRTTPFEILYIDDGSTDSSSQLMDNLAAQHQQITGRFAVRLARIRVHDFAPTMAVNTLALDFKAVLVANRRARQRGAQRTARRRRR